MVFIGNPRSEIIYARAFLFIYNYFERNEIFLKFFENREQESGERSTAAAAAAPAHHRSHPQRPTATRNIPPHHPLDSRAPGPRHSLPAHRNRRPRPLRAACSSGDPSTRSLPRRRRPRRQARARGFAHCGTACMKEARTKPAQLEDAVSRRHTSKGLRHACTVRWRLCVFSGA